MRVLLDHCVPRRLASMLAGHEVSTAREMEWDHLRNSALLNAAAAAGFGAVITVDQNLKHQQNPGALPIAVVVIVSASNDIDDLAPLVPRVLRALGSLPARRLIEVSA